MINTGRRRGIMGDIGHEPLAESSSELKPGGRLFGKALLPRSWTGIYVEALQDRLDVIGRLKRRRVVESPKHLVKLTLSEDRAGCEDQEKDGPKCHDNVQRPLSSCRKVKRSPPRSWL